MSPDDAAVALLVAVPWGLGFFTGALSQARRSTWFTGMPTIVGSYSAE